MNALRSLTSLAVVMLGLSASPAFAQRGGDANIPDEVRALMMRHGAKGLAEDYEGKRNDPTKASRPGQGGGSGGCNVEIGNVNNANRGGPAPRQVTTIITGPVIQSNNKCN